MIRSGQLINHSSYFHFRSRQRVSAFWKALGATATSTHYMLDGEGFWLKKISLVAGLSTKPQENPKTAYFKMFVGRVQLTVQVRDHAE